MAPCTLPGLDEHACTCGNGRALTKIMSHLSSLGRWILVLVPSLTLGMPISAISGMARAPDTVAAAWCDGSFLQQSGPPGPGPIDIALPPERGTSPDLSLELPLIPSAMVARSTATPGTSMSTRSQTQFSLTLFIFIMFLLGALVRYLRSPAFYDVISDVCFTLYAIEHEGRDGRT